MSSISTTTTLGASSGALTSKRGGGVALRASSSRMVGGTGSATGRTLRSNPPPAGVAGLSFFAHAARTSMTASAVPARPQRSVAIEYPPGKSAQSTAGQGARIRLVVQAMQPGERLIVVEARIEDEHDESADIERRDERHEISERDDRAVALGHAEAQQQ